MIIIMMTTMMMRSHQLTLNQKHAKLKKKKNENVDIKIFSVNYIIIFVVVIFIMHFNGSFLTFSTLFCKYYFMLNGIKTTITTKN